MTQKFGFYINDRLKKVKLHREDCPYWEQNGGEQNYNQGGWVWCDSGYSDSSSLSMAELLASLQATHLGFRMTRCGHCRKAGRI